MTTTAETRLEQTVREEQELHDQAEAAGVSDEEFAAATQQAPKGEDADKGKLFEVPRVTIAVDESDPSVIKLAFSGSVELERGDKTQASFYNRLKAGREVELEVTAFVAGPMNTHRRDSEGNVDAIVQTKSLTITDVVHSA